MSEAPAPKRHRRLFLIAPWTIFALAALSWCAYWFFAAELAQTRVNAFAAQQRAHGAQLAIGAIRAHGFPMMLRLELQGVEYASAPESWRARTDRIDLHANLTNPAHVIFEAKTPIDVRTTDGARHVIEANALLVSLRFRREALATFGIEADALMLDNPARVGVVRAEKLVANLRPDPRGGGASQLALEMRHLSLARPVRSFEGFGQEIALMRAAIALTQAEALLAPGEVGPIESWRQASGGAAIEALELQWGALEAHGHGQAALDDAQRLRGALEIDIPAPGPAVAALASSPELSDDARGALALVAAGLAFSGDGASFSVNAQDGALSIENVPVRTLTPLY